MKLIPEEGTMVDLGVKILEKSLESISNDKNALIVFLLETIC